MRFTTYSKYHPELADAVNLQGAARPAQRFPAAVGIRGRVAVVLARRCGTRASGRWTRCGRPSSRRSWIRASSRPTCSRCCGASPPATPSGTRRSSAQLGELLDKIVQRLIEEGYLNVSQAPAGAAGLPVDVRPRRPGALGGAAGAVQSDREGHRLPRLQDAQEPARQRRQVELRRARHAVPRHRGRGRGREQALRVRRRAEPRRAGHAHQRHRARRARRPASTSSTAT